MRSFLIGGPRCGFLAHWVKDTISISVWVLLGFAAWTVLTLLGSVGVYRWSRILTGRSSLTDFPADAPRGNDWYRRAMRAHANCVENLPVYTAIVVVIIATGVQSIALDAFAVVLLAARIAQTFVHIGFAETNTTVGVRFGFFPVQLVCMFTMGTLVALNA